MCEPKLFVFLLILSFFPLVCAEILFTASARSLQTTQPKKHTEIAEFIAAQNLFNSKKYSAAIPLYRDVIINHHDVSARAYLMIGRCYFEQKAYSQARKWFNELVATFPNELESMQTELKMYWGASFFYEQKFAEALEKFTGEGIPGADAIPPMEQPWYDMVGRCYEQRNMKKSLEAYNPHSFKYVHLAPIPKQNSLLIRPHYWEIADKKKELRNLALYRIGESYLNEKRYEDAIHILQKINHTPFYKDAALLIGRSYFEAGKYNRASEYFEERIKEYGHPPPIFFYYLGLSHYYQHRYEEAIKDFTLGRQVEDAKIPAECQYRIADSLYSLKRYTEALKEYNKILMEYPPSNRKIQAKYRKEKCQSLLSAKEN